MKLAGMRLAVGFVRCAAVLLVAVGVAHGQELRGEESSQGPRPAAQSPTEPAQGSGILDRLRAGVLEVFTGNRLQVHVNGAYQDSSGQSKLETVLRTSGEQSRLLTREDFRGGGHVDVGGSLRIWRGLVIGASYTQVRNAGSAVVTGTVPHPIEVGRDRTVPEQTVSLPHRQRAAHGYVGWRIPFGDALQVELSVGPTYFSLRRGVVVNLTPMEVGGPPFAEVGLQLDAGEHTRNGAGFNAGIDLTYMFTPATRIPQVGVGYFVRFADGAVSLPVTAATQRGVPVGGFQTGAGFRLRF